MTNSTIYLLLNHTHMHTLRYTLQAHHRKQVAGIPF